jgi:hypothetical protein
MIEHRGIKVPSTVDDWQLYHQPGSPRAAEALTKAACEVVDLIAETKIGDAKGEPQRWLIDLKWSAWSQDEGVWDDYAPETYKAMHGGIASVEETGKLGDHHASGVSRKTNR